MNKAPKGAFLLNKLNRVVYPEKQQEIHHESAI